MNKQSLIAASLMLVSITATAAVPKPEPVPGKEQSQQFNPSGAYAQLYYYPAAQREKSTAAGARFDYEGDGFGISAYLPFKAGDYSLFAIADYSSIDYDDVRPAQTDSIIDELRLGLGYQFNQSWSAYLHYNDRKNSDSTNAGSDGYAVHGVYTMPFAGTPFSAYADIGYFQLTNESDFDIDGYEFWVGGLYAINKRYTGFVDYRASDFDVDNAAKTSIKYYDFRIGARMNF